MNTSKLHILVILCLSTCPAMYSQPDFTSYNCDNDDGNYTTMSGYKKNLHTLLSSITSNAHVNYGFYNLSVGNYLDKVHGLALCRGDIPTPHCKTCINNAASKITLVCPNEQTAIGWYETCMIWYSNQDIFKGEMSKPRYNLTNGRIAPSPKSFNHSVANLMMELANEAALGDSRRKFATGETNVSTTVTVHALLQCVPDLEAYDCLNCLRLIINYTLAECCYGMLGVRAAGATCNIRYENYMFYKSAIALPPLSSPPPFLPSASPPTSTFTGRKGSRRKRTRVTIATIISTVASLLILVLMLVGCYLKRGKNKIKNFQNEEEGEFEMTDSFKLDFSVLKAATNDFSESNKLGQGGFGTVYKGVLASTGQVIAVKRLSTTAEQGEKEFETEALIVAKLQHKNLVKFLGYCLAKDERLMVFEYVPNKSLDRFLFDPIKCAYLDWQKRYKIIGGIARGLLYLHEESRLLVVHRDLKPSNVLLDDEMNPKISDFGMARLFTADQSHANTSRIAGTYGYMPPEYVVQGQFSIKTDVFSFGVLILEIITGHKVSKFSQAESGESLLSFVWRNWPERSVLKLVSSTITEFNSTEALRCINIGLLCVQENAAKRPIMSSIVLMLNSYSMTLPVPSRPAFLVLNNNDMDVSMNEASLSTLDPR